MGRPSLIARLAARDLRRHRAQAVLLLLAITAAAATLTLGLVLRGVTSNPYQQTRAATAGPDVVASYLNLSQPPRRLAAGLRDMTALGHAPGVTGHAGPYPVAWPILRIHGLRAGVLAEGRTPGRAAIDQPKLTQGGWVRPGGVVVERSFADALRARVGDRVTLNGRPFRIDGIAVTAANEQYPNADFVTYGGPFPTPQCGMMWLTEADARSLATRALPLSYLLNLKLAHPARAPAFVSAHGPRSPMSLLGLSSWQDIRQADDNMVRNEQRTLLVGGLLLTLLAIASVAVLVGGRMADQTRRVGLLKAVGGTPKLVAAVLLAENLALALIAAAAGLGAGWLAAPLLTSPGAGLVGAPGAPSFSASTAAWVATVALAVALAATFVPAVRAARTSTISALADAARLPRRRAMLIAISARLPVPLLLGLRLAARRPRRAVLGAASIAITATTIVAVLTVRAHQAQVESGIGFSALGNPRYHRIDQVLLVLTVMMIALAAVTAVFTTWATALDARYSSALTRALGATPQQVSAGLSAAQLLPALPGALAGIPLGIGLVKSVGHGSPATMPSAWWLVAVVLGTLLAVAGLTTIAARIGARRPAAGILQAE